MANLCGLTAAEVGFLVVKPFKKHSFLANGTNGGEIRNAPIVCLFSSLWQTVGISAGIILAVNG